MYLATWRDVIMDDPWPLIPKTKYHFRVVILWPFLLQTSPSAASSSPESVSGLRGFFVDLESNHLPISDSNVSTTQIDANVDNNVVSTSDAAIVDSDWEIGDSECDLNVSLIVWDKYFMEIFIQIINHYLRLQY